MATRTKTKASATSANPLLVGIVKAALPRRDAALAFKAAQENLGAASRGLWAACIDLVQGCKSIDQVYALIGNGQNAKSKTYMAGAWAEVVKSECAGANMTDEETLAIQNSVKSQLSKARTIAVAVFEFGYVIDPALGREKQLAAAQVACGKVEPTSETETEAHAPDGIGDIEALIAHFGLGAVLNHCAKILATDRKTALDGKTLDVISKKYVS